MGQGHRIRPHHSPLGPGVCSQSQRRVKHYPHKVILSITGFFYIFEKTQAWKNSNCPKKWRIFPAKTQQTCSDLSSHMALKLNLFFTISAAAVWAQTAHLRAQSRLKKCSFWCILNKISSKHSTAFFPNLQSSNVLEKTQGHRENSGFLASKLNLFLLLPLCAIIEFVFFSGLHDGVISHRS